MTRISMFCFVAAVACSTTFAADPVLSMSSKDWKYFDGGAAPEGWSSPAFDDAQWKSGQAPLGYGDDYVEHEVSFGGDTANKHITTFFRHTFDNNGTPAAESFQAQLICDDGCVAYINGEEVFRYNMPQGEITDETTATATAQGDMEQHKFTFLVATEMLKPGKNSVAVRVHQRSKDSSDLGFDMSLSPLLTDAEINKAKEALEDDKRVIAASATDPGNSPQSQRSQRPPRPLRPEFE